MDKYATEGDGASQLINSIVLKLLQSENSQHQIHAFNLLFNLSIHINLWDEISIFSDAKNPSPRTHFLIYLSPPSQTIINNNNNIY